MIYNDMHLADSVLSLFKALCYNIDSPDLIQRQFSSGLEQGYILSNCNTGATVAFAQSCTSDNLVVYYGSNSVYNVVTGQPEPADMWESPKYFSYTDLYSGVKWIQGYLVGQS